MRLELLYNPRLLCERLAEISLNHRRLAKLRGTLAGHLTSGHIDSLELLELVRPLNPQVIFDVGANVGTWTLLAKALYPQSQIHAFEPLEAHCKAFGCSTSMLSGVALHRLALGAVSANLQMQVLNRSDASSLLMMTEECGRRYDLRGERIVAVTVERLDDFVRANALPQPDLIKLDIQGYELEAMRGGDATLRGVRAVLTEVSFVKLYHGQCLFHDLVVHLAECGFRLWAFGERTDLGKPLLQADALFLTESARLQLER